MRRLTDSEWLNKEFLNSDNWGCESVVEQKFLWMSSLLHELDIEHQKTTVDRFLASLKR